MGTSYSLDLETALAVPLALTLFAPESRDELLSSPLAMLEGLERNSGRLAVFCDAGCILAHATAQSRLCTLLEQMVVEVTAPRGGAFHPKVWALRYKPLNEGEQHKLRLIILSRNLTRDQSWDLALCLDGTVGEEPQQVNDPLGDFLRRIPELSRKAVSGHVSELVNSLAASVQRAKWTLPEPFENVSFAVNGFGPDVWQPKRSTKMGIVSPFCDAAALIRLAESTQEAPLLVSRAEQLDALCEAVRAKFAEVSVMEERASVQGDEVNEASQSEALSGLHAKAYIQEYDRETRVIVGSGNATSPALISGRNVEVFATLTGRKSRVGRVSEILGSDSFGLLLAPYKFGEGSSADDEQIEAEKRVGRAVKKLVDADLSVHCQLQPDDANGDSLWRLVCHVGQALKLEGIASVTVWPITRNVRNGRDVLDCIQQGGSFEIAILPLADVTQFLNFRLEDASRKAKKSFTLGFEVQGLPANRTDSVVRSLVSSPESFLRYLRLLLADLSDPFSAQIAARSADAHSSHESGITSMNDQAVLEDMVRTLSHGRERLANIGRLMRRLEGFSSNGTASVPPEFLDLWKSFSVALDLLEKNDARDG